MGLMFIICHLFCRTAAVGSGQLFLGRRKRILKSIRQDWRQDPTKIPEIHQEYSHNPKATIDRINCFAFLNSLFYC
jgi:hypothetical protein